MRKIATRHGVPHSLLAIWIRKYEAGELAEEVYLQEQVSEYEARIGALERKIGQLTMELDVMKKRALIRPSDQSAPTVDHLRSWGVPVRRGMWPHEHGEKHVLQTTERGACGRP